MTELCDLTALEARRLIGLKKISPVELLESCLARIEATNPAVNAVVAMDEERARAEARAAEQAVMDGEELGLLHGLPIGIKDLTETEGLRTTFGSLLYKDHVPKSDARQVARIRNEGGIAFAKTNTPEFGAGANTRNRVYGATGNAFDPKLTCAGSSGGSAVALALGQMPLATGSDYGGSLRTPASFSGIVGFRPSPGLVPSESRPASLNPFSVEGPMGRTVADAHLLLKTQIDVDKLDPFSSDDCFRIPAELGGVDLASVHAAFSPDLACAPVDNDIRRVFAERTAIFRSVFAEAADAAPDFANVHDTFEILRGVAFVAAHRERFEKHRDLLDRNVTDNTERGLAYSLGDVARAHVQQTGIYRRVLDFFDSFDVLICPAAAVTPFPHTQLFVDTINGDAMPTYMRWLALAYAPTTALCCSAVIPCGRDHAGMPFGVQVIGANGTDALVLEVAHALEHVLAEHALTRRAIPDLGKLNA